MSKLGILFMLMLIAHFALKQHSCVSGQVDRTMEIEAAGIDVVFVSVSRITQSGIFAEDNRFLRRLAYVEGRDGVDVSTYSDPDYHGGIWQVNEDFFLATQDVTMYPHLLGIYGELFSQFQIEWATFMWEDLRKPFISALAARLYLSIVELQETIPAAGALEAQGEYWTWHYSNDSADTVQFFVDSVNEFELEECPIRGIDLAFVFDSSGSVGLANFQREINFAIDVTDTFNVGPEDTQIANIAYSGIARISFFFNTFTDRAAVTQALSEVEYFDIRVPRNSGQGTNTAQALTRLREEVFVEERGARESRFGIPRVAVVITDGQSNVNEGETIPSAQRLHADGVIVFAVGVGADLNMKELDAIASRPEFRVLLNSFSITEFTTLQRTISAEVCIIPAPIEIETEIEGTLFFGDFSFFEFQLPTSGMTLRLEGESGRTVMFASDKIRNPNSAFYDFRYDSGNSGGLFVSPEGLMSRGKRQAETESVSINSNTTLYVTVQGLSERNNFTLLTTFGNTSGSNKLGATLSTLAVLVIFAMVNLF